MPAVLKIECVLSVEPGVRINLLRQDKSGGKLYLLASFEAPALRPAHGGSPRLE
jgi:hypothetical protein